MPSQKLWWGSMMLQLQILHPFSSAPTYLPEFDTVSYLYRREKRQAYTTAIKNLTDLLPLCRYGDPEESLDVQEEVITAAR